MVNFYRRHPSFIQANPQAWRQKKKGNNKADNQLKSAAQWKNQSALQKLKYAQITKLI